MKVNLYLFFLFCYTLEERFVNMMQIVAFGVVTVRSIKFATICEIHQKRGVTP